MRKKNHHLVNARMISHCFNLHVTGNIIVKNLREKLFTSIVRQEIGFFDKNKTGELINRLSTDTSLVGRSITMNVSDGLRAVAQGVGGVGMMVSQ